MQYFTGSKAHNIALRDRAIGRGLKLNEYGLFQIEGNERIAGQTEDEVYQALGLAWVPPDRGGDGARFEIRVDRRRLGARVTHGSFFDPAGERMRS